MTMLSTTWQLHCEVTPEWLFVRLNADDQGHAPESLNDEVWREAQQHQIFRLVFEKDDRLMLTSHLVGQLVLLHKRCHEAGGVARICAFDSSSYEVLRTMRLHERFPNYVDRHAAVNGFRPDD